MKTRILTLMLIVSVLFNLFFAVGFFDARTQAQRTATPEGPAQAVAEKMRLTDVQRQGLAEVRRLVGQHMREANQAREANLRAAQVEMAQPQPDLVKIRRLMQDNARVQAEVRTFAMEHMAEFLKTLSPEQRVVWSQMVPQPGGPRPGGGPWEPHPGAHP
jgi:uncharacterized membrane protein